MSRTSSFPLADKALGGQLKKRLRAARKRGDSFETIARDLHNDGIALSGETVRRWCNELQIEGVAS